MLNTGDTDTYAIAIYRQADKQTRIKKEGNGVRARYPAGTNKQQLKPRQMQILEPRRKCCKLETTDA